MSKRDSATASPEWHCYAVELDEVSYRYRRGAPLVVDAVSASLPPGAVVVVDGRNGAGKSTLLQLVAGVLRPTSGAVRGRPRIVSWVPETFPADQPFTLAGYLGFVAGMRGLVGPAAARAVTLQIERLGLQAFRGTRLTALSKGTAQKVGLAQALLVTPDLLVLDEPWEGLDVASRELVPTLVTDVTGAGGAVAVSDHRGEAGRLPGAARWHLHHGRLASITEAVADMCVVEVSMTAASASAAVALLRAAGHDNVRVRAVSAP